LPRAVTLKRFLAPECVFDLGTIAGRDYDTAALADGPAASLRAGSARACEAPASPRSPASAGGPSPLAGPAAGAATSGAGPGAGGSQGGGAGGGTGAAPGPGTGGEGGYIFVASPRTAILPPLARVPGSVAGRTYVVKFWVAADGRVTRVEIDPPIADAAYSREFQQRMMAYQFYPARTRDGRNVASVVLVPLRIGN